MNDKKEFTVEARLRIKELVQEKEAQTGAKITFKALASMTGVHEITLGRYNGGRTTSFDSTIMYKLMDFFGIPTTELHRLIEFKKVD